ncbi:MAG: TetR/AcrR family transcriptional regulator [Alphaproteobacteria bacterium]|nr:TetR/AcrR family transcriptional regulator [Rhodospirillales bacterium]MCW9046091.1 TetR/AcrR family transcriptional regulator [Alphaproteobacteria bacterium]
MATKKTIEDKIIDSALALAEETSWQNVTLSEVATKAGCDLTKLRQTFDSKPAILNGFLKRIDLEVLSQHVNSGDETPRDRLFDVMMGRFDALQDYRPAVVSIANSISRHPLGGLCTLPQFMNSMAWMLEAAGIKSSGLKGALKIRGLALLYGRAFKTWVDDDSDDMAPTMAALDRVLDKAERVMNFCNKASKPSEKNAASAQG